MLSFKESGSVSLNTYTRYTVSSFVSNCSVVNLTMLLVGEVVRIGPNEVTSLLALARRLC